VWIVHPWSMGPLPTDLPNHTLVIGAFVSDFHQAWPWSMRRWQFVGRRMAHLAPHRWHDRSEVLAKALATARSVRSVSEPHLAPWLARMAECIAAPCPFTPVALRCDSFSKWWPRASRDLKIPS
jgi:deoxyribodipyrimidine photo-lyase